MRGTFVSIFFVLASASALAAPIKPSLVEGWLEGSILKTQTEQLVLGSPEVLETLGKILKRNLSSLDDLSIALREAGPESLQAFERIQAQSRRITESLREARKARAGEKADVDSVALSAEESAIVRLAVQEVSWSEQVLSKAPGGLKSQRIVTRNRLDLGREEFMAAKAAANDNFIPIKATPGESAPPAIGRAARRSFVEWARESEACRARQPEALSSKLDRRDLMQQMGITAGVNTGAYLVTVGLGQFDPGTYAVDMSLSLFFTWAGMKVMKNTDSLVFRSFKVYGMGHGRNRLDMELYEFLPTVLPNWLYEHGAPTQQDAANRLAFNYEWTNKTFMLSPILFSILNGHECLLRESAAAGKAAKFAKGAFGVKLAVGAGMSLLYYKVRESSLAK
jgi:hypothetical protein